MFGRKAILPLDAVLKLETSPIQGSALTYLECVIKQKQQLAETEQLARENLQRSQKSQKAYYDAKCYGQQFQVGDQVWYRNQARMGRKKFLKPWCGPWKVVKVLSDVANHIEEEIRKPVERRRQWRVVHFNYLKPCHSPPQETLSPTASLRRLQEPDQLHRTPVGSRGVGSRAEAGSNVENPSWPWGGGIGTAGKSCFPCTDVLHHPEVLVGNSTVISDSAVADNPSQPTAVSVSSGNQVAESSQTRVRPRRE